MNRKGWEFLLVFGCCELLPLYRAHLGFGFLVVLICLCFVKHMLLHYLPAHLFIQHLHLLCGLLLIGHLGERIWDHTAAMIDSRLEASYTGMPWFRVWLGFSDAVAMRWLEPALCLFLAFQIAVSPVMPHLTPLYDIGFLSRPFGENGPYPWWYKRFGITLAHLYPFILFACLTAWNWIDCEDREVRYGGKQPRSKRRKKAPAVTESVAQVPYSETPVAVPSVQAMTEALEGTHTPSKEDTPWRKTTAQRP